MSRRAVLVMAWVGCVVLLSSCGQDGRICTAVGGPPPGVEVLYDQVQRGDHSGRLLVRACVDTSCQSVDVTRLDSPNYILVGSDVVRDGTPVVVGLTITDSRQRTVFKGQTTVTPKKVQPNGQGCGPVAWVGAAAARGDHELTALTSWAETTVVPTR